MAEKEIELKRIALKLTEEMRKLEAQKQISEMESMKAMEATSHAAMVKAQSVAIKPK